MDKFLLYLNPEKIPGYRKLHDVYMSRDKRGPELTLLQ